ncbi:MAG: hypothetical protein JW896_15185 [Deltaproteobacteria bacterium]|nr:hypothetical protein [Deltaproteobacteria bacterium]
MEKGVFFDLDDTLVTHEKLVRSAVGCCPYEFSIQGISLDANDRVNRATKKRDIYSSSKKDSYSTGCIEDKNIE